MSESFCFIYYEEVHMQNFRNIFVHNRVMKMKPQIHCHHQKLVNKTFIKNLNK